jgi:formylglycine-generating enzyme required for sulfatase activity
VPHLVWCKVLAGPFRLGGNNNEEAHDYEKPQHELTLPTFYIARYPITNAQFALFVEDGGYNDRQWWTEAGWAWRHGAEPDLSWITDTDFRERYAEHIAQLRPIERRHEPFSWHDERLNLPTQPVTGVSWYEAMAYCTWLQQQLILHGRSVSVDGVSWDTLLTSGSWQVRLPTEAEWEKAAGWDVVAGHKRVYAWGNEWEKAMANVANQVGLPSAVGVFPAGAAACGALDMTGNVWEWTLSRFMGYPYGHDSRHDPEGEDERVLRGGGWSDNHWRARVSVRTDSLPLQSAIDIGMRVVLGPVLK